MQVVKPPAPVIAQLRGTVNAMFEQVNTLATAKSNNLRRTRDLLLPRLLSGQIEVEAA